MYLASLQILLCFLTMAFLPLQFFSYHIPSDSSHMTSFRCLKHTKILTISKTLPHRSLDPEGSVLCPVLCRADSLILQVSLWPPIQIQLLPFPTPHSSNSPVKNLVSFLTVNSLLFHMFPVEWFLACLGCKLYEYKNHRIAMVQRSILCPQ